MFYSANNNGFYSRETHGDRIPDDSIEITDKQYEELLDGQNTGKKISSGEGGHPVLLDPAPQSPEFFAGVERAWRGGQLTATDGVISRHRDELEEGPTTLTPTQYAELQAYRRALRNWPEADEFPLIDRRPPAPDWLAEQLQ
ncbi:phage tail protein [Pseudomonas chlororaphis]|uniref:phage tail protein n=1 Tax=Pseudomonas chlororaphis TaxID=587753 RepID=UPI002366232D|nr:phage tail protein [Pseudomonas chlororaphis]WDG55015.1 phage tail protein [Pseudomonas chlororaphis]WDH89783.1 phage tail protein [Pseudomonas chlororaphis]